MKAILLSLALAGCATDPACDTCLASRLTLDSTGFVDAGGRWLSRISDPVLSGTVDGAQPVHLFAGSFALGAADIADEQWSMHVPPGTVTPDGVAIRIVVDDHSAELTQTFVLAERPALRGSPPAETR